MAVKRLLAMRPVILGDERRTRGFHVFLFADMDARSRSFRSLELRVQPNSFGLDNGKFCEFAGLVLDILVHATYLETLSVPFGDRTFNYLRDPRIPAAISQMPSLRNLSLPEFTACPELILSDMRARLEKLEVSLQGLPASSTGHGIPPVRVVTPVTPTQLDSMLVRHASTLEVLRLRKRAVRLDPNSEVQYPAIRSVRFSSLQGPPWMDVLVHKFPNLCDSLYLGTVDTRLLGTTAQQARARELNKEHQTRRAWRQLDRVVGDPTNLYMLALACPVRHLTVDAFCSHLKMQLVESLRDARPAHLKLTVLLAHGVDAFNDLFPPEAVSRLTHLTLVVVYDNLDDVDDVDRFTLSSIQWGAFLDVVVDSVRHLRLTHLRFIVHYTIDLSNEAAPRPYSKRFVRSLRELDHGAVAASLMEAVPSLQHVFVDCGGQYEIKAPSPGSDTVQGGPGVLVRLVTRDRWMSSTSWVRKSQQGVWCVERLDDDVGRRMLADEELGVSDEDEVRTPHGLGYKVDLDQCVQWILGIERKWTEEETAEWTPPGE